MVWSPEQEGVLVISGSSKPCWEVDNKRFVNALDFLLSKCSLRIKDNKDGKTREMGVLLCLAVTSYAYPRFDWEAM